MERGVFRIVHSLRGQLPVHVVHLPVEIHPFRSLKRLNREIRPMGNGHSLLFISRLINPVINMPRMPRFKPRNLDRYPRLDTVLMVEKALYKYKSDLTLGQIWKKLPKKVLWTTYTTILDYLEYSGKIIVEKDRTVTWIWDPEGIRKLKGRGLEWHGKNNAPSARCLRTNRSGTHWKN